MLNNENENNEVKKLTKKKGSIAGLGSLGRKTRPSKLEKGTNGNENGHHVTASSESEAERTASTTSASRESKEKKVSFNDWSVVKFVEQYDPNDLTSISQPYAYVGDYLVEVKLGASVNEEAKTDMQLYLSEIAWWCGWLLPS